MAATKRGGLRRFVVHVDFASTVADLQHGKVSTLDSASKQPTFIKDSFSMHGEGTVYKQALPRSTPMTERNGRVHDFSIYRMILLGLLVIIAILQLLILRKLSGPVEVAGYVDVENTVDVNVTNEPPQ